MFFITSKLIAFLSKPIFWLFILIISSILFKTKRKKLLYITVFVFYLLTNNFIADNFSRIWQIAPKEISSLTDNYKYGIVLGGYSSYNQAIKHINLNENGDRIISAIELYKLKKIKKIILSGGSGELSNPNMKESEWSEEILLNMGVKKEDILLDKNSRNTMENAQQTAIIIGTDTINKSLLITSGSHMRRAKLCFIKNNLNIETYSTDCISYDIPITFNYLFIPNVKALEKWESLIHEWIGYIVYKIRF